MTRLRSVIDFSLAVLVAASALYSLPFLVSAAHAGVDPVPVATTSVDAVLAIAQTYGALWGGVTLAYALVRWLLARNAEKNWLAQGRTLATITMLVGTAGSALQAHFAGTPWSGVIATAVLGVVHLADSNVTPTPTAKTSQAGFARLGLLALLAGAGVWITLMFSVPVVAGCAASQRGDTIKAALVTVDGARDGFLAYDRAHEQQLVAESTSPEDAHAKLAAYQAKRAQVDPLFGAAYRGIAAAQILNDDTSLTGMQAAIAQLFAALKPLLGGK